MEKELKPPKEYLVNCDSCQMPTPQVRHINNYQCLCCFQPNPYDMRDCFEIGYTDISERVYILEIRVTALTFQQLKKDNIIKVQNNKLKLRK